MMAKSNLGRNKKKVTIVTLSFALSIVPVSYTHLDVYKRQLLEELRKSLPYDAMGGQNTIPILVLQEFRKPDIVEKIRDFIGCQAGFSDHDLLQEIQKFMTVHLDPQGIILYMDVLGNQPVARNAYKQGGQMW